MRMSQITAWWLPPASAALILLLVYYRWPQQIGVANYLVWSLGVAVGELILIKTTNNLSIQRRLLYALSYGLVMAALLFLESVYLGGMVFDSGNL